MTKRRWVVLGVALAVVIFCLWYTRPRSFGDLTGGEPIVSVGGTGTLFLVEKGEPRIESQSMDGRTCSDEILNGLLELLESCQYRVRLRNLLPFWRETESKIDVPMVMAGATLGEGGAGTVHAMYMEDKVTFWVTLPDGRSREILASTMDRELTEKLYAYIKEYGSQS